MNVQPINAARVNEVSQPFQRGTLQGRAAVAVVEKPHLGFQTTAIGLDAIFQGGDLALNCRLLVLAL